MILVERNKVPIPKILESEKAKSAEKEASAYFSQPVEKRGQEKFRFQPEVYVDLEVKSALLELFSHKLLFLHNSPQGPLLTPHRLPFHHNSLELFSHKLPSQRKIPLALCLFFHKLPSQHNSH